ASSRRTSSESGTLELQETTLVVDAERAVAAESPGGDDAVAWKDERQPVVGAEGAGRPRRLRTAGERGELAVADRLTVGHGAQGLCDRALERRAPLQIDGDVPERHPLALEVRGDPAGKFRHGSATDACARTG